ncbi:MAG: DUF805 domain-containing protein [Lachnospiraceae bacterium]|nr:DUF805 domain-containing protein [Lachnospiraceae bacterium]
MDVNFFSAQLKLWARRFDYKGTSSRKEYWFAFILEAVLFALAFVNVTLSFIPVLIVHYIFLVIGLLIFLYLFVSIVPWISLTVRRLRDGGKSVWWALLMLVVGIGNVILLFICMTASAIVIGVFAPELNRPVCVYGPPEYFDPSYNEPDAVYGPPSDYDPENNVNEDVYGPPVDDYDPSNNQEPDVYGPPVDDYEPNLNLNEVVYGPPEWFDDNNVDEDDTNNDFDPSRNEQNQVYGPPKFDE